MKCVWAEARSVSSTCRHLATNSEGVIDYRKVYPRPWESGACLRSGGLGAMCRNEVRPEPGLSDRLQGASPNRRCGRSVHAVKIAKRQACLTIRSLTGSVVRLLVDKSCCSR